MTKTVELEPGSGLGLDMTINDGESIIVIKALKDGSIQIPMFASNLRFPESESRAQAIQLCCAAIKKLSD